MRNEIEELQNKIKAEFEVTARIMFARMNQELKYYNQFSDTGALFSEEHVTGDKRLVEFYAPNSEGEIHGALLVNPDVQSEVIPKKPASARNMAFHPRDGLLGCAGRFYKVISAKLPEGRHSVAHELKIDHLSGASKAQFGFGFNFPVSESSARELREINLELLGRLPAVWMEEKIEGSAGFEFSGELLTGALRKLEKAVENGGAFPEGYDLEKIVELKLAALKKQTAEEKSESIEKS